MPSLRLALRRFLRQPAFTALAVFTLAVGLGACAAIYAVVDAVLLRPLDYPQPERLVAVQHSAPGLQLPVLEMSARLYLHYQEHSESLVGLGLYDETSAAVSGLEQPLQVNAATLTPSVLTTLGARPVQGRLFTEAEGEQGTAPAVIVSEGFWRRNLGADPDILQRTLTVDGNVSSIVGVMPSSFAFPSNQTEIWIPRILDPANVSLGSFGSSGLARLAPGATLETAGNELMQLLGDLEATFPEESAARVLAEADFAAYVRPLHQTLVGDLSSMLWLILATAAFVMLLAVVNVTNLVLARSEGRQREVAIRGALGATWASQARAALSEGLALALAGGACGLLLGKLGLSLILRYAPGELPVATAVAIDSRTVLLLTGLSLLCAVVFAAVPILRQWRGQLVEHLKEGGRSATSGRGQHRLRRALVAAQMAIAILLLIGAGLMIRSFVQLSAVDAGFVAADGISFRLSLPPTKASEDYQGAQFYEQLLTRLVALPGVSAAASTTAFPLGGRFSGSGHRSREAVARGEAARPTVMNVQSISPGYFATAGIPLLQGRVLERADYEQRSGKVVISESTARLLWPGENAVGKEIYPGSPDEGEAWLQVVGVVGDVRMRTLAEPPTPVVYYPWLNPTPNMWDVDSQTVVLRLAQGSQETLMAAVRREVWALDGDLPIAEVLSLEGLQQRASARMAFTALLLAIAAGAALLLGAVGTCGVVSFLAAQRTAEIGVRLAVGAQRRDVLQLVLREGLLMAASGGLVGLMLAGLLSSSLESMLYQTTPLDPMTYVAVPVLLLLVACLACLGPARRAADVDPVVALRSD